MPVEYTLFGPPRPWTPADVVAVAALIGGIFGDGGGGEIGNAALLQLPAAPARPGRRAATAFTEFKEQNDPAAPTTVVDKSFPYEIPGTGQPGERSRMPDHPGAPLTGGADGPDQAAARQTSLEPGRPVGHRGACCGCPPR